MKRGSYLQRKAPLKRSRMKRKSPWRLKRAGSDQARLAWARTQPCVMAWRGKCWGPIHAHHAGAKPGVGLKAPDDTVISFCAGDHKAWHDAEPPFFAWTKEERREWADARIAEARWAYAIYLRAAA